MDLPLVPQDMSLADVLARFKDLGIEYRNWSRHGHQTDQEVVAWYEPPWIPEKGDPPTPPTFTMSAEEIAECRRKDAEESRQKAIRALRGAYLEQWADSLTFNELKSELRKVRPDPLTQWEQRSWTEVEYRNELLKHTPLVEQQQPIKRKRGRPRKYPLLKTE